MKKGEWEVSLYEFMKEIKVLGDYMLFFVSCASYTVVSFEIMMMFVNKDVRGCNDYLGVGEKLLLSVYYLFFLLDMCVVVVWVFIFG